MAKKQFSTLEIIGGTAAVMAVALFLYLNSFYDPLSVRYNQINRKWEKISSEVEELRAASEGGRIERDLRRLNSRLKKVKKELGKAELILAQGSDREKLSNEIIQTASECGLWVKDFIPVNREKLKEITRKKKIFYERSFYKIVIHSTFNRLLVFLEKIADLPHLVTVEKIDMGKENEKEHLKISLLLSI